MGAIRDFLRHLFRSPTSNLCQRRGSPWRRTALRLEQLESRRLMHANPVMDAEHLAVFGALDPDTGVITGGLVPDSAVTTRSIASGLWSDPSIWSDGVPTNGDNVLISVGTVVTVDGMVDKDAGGKVALRTLRDDGTLRFDTTVNTRLLVDTIIVEPSGRFEMGTEDNPIAVGRTARITFADPELTMSAAEQKAWEDADRAWDPLQFSRGLVSHGEVSIHGSSVESFIQVPTGLKAKSNTFDVGPTVPEGWQVGDRLVITGNTAANAKNVNQDEELAIKSIQQNPTTSTFVVTLSAPLKFAHAAGSTYVADVSRNAVLDSENPKVVARRGHVMFMHNDDVHVEGAGFYGLGRTDKRTLIDDPVLVPDTDNPGQMTTDVLKKNVDPAHPELGHRVLVPVLDASGRIVPGKFEIARTGLNPRGRYAVHFHRTGLDHHGDHEHESASIDGSAVVDSPGWGIVNHSANVAVTGNVVFNAVGAAYVTEAGDEIGSFDRNIAIHALGSGQGIESREQVQDFGHQGDGFWLQGGNVSVTNNVVSGQRHAGYVFFPVGLKQNGLGTTTISGVYLDEYAWADPTKMYAVGDVPLKEFKGNVAFASGTGFESWFTLLNAKHQDRSVIEDLGVWQVGGRGVFTPYTNHMTLKNVTVLGRNDAPGGTAFARNNVTRNMIYDHVRAEGWAVGIDTPVNGTNRIVGGTFNNLKNIYVATANSRERRLDIDDAGPTDPIVFLDNLTSVVKKKIVRQIQIDVFLETNYNPKDQDLTKLFNPDIIRMGTVAHNGKQLYYLEQGASFKPFDTTRPGGVPTWVPQDLRDKTGQQIFDQYGLAIGGVVAPQDATASDPRINALIGSPSAYQPDLKLTSAKYFNFANAPYKLSYKVFDANLNKYVTVKETTPTPLVGGWNLITRTILGATRTLLVYGDVTGPTFALNPKVPLVINQADIDRGSTFVLAGFIEDDSFGRRNLRQEIKLSDATKFSAVKTREDGSKFVTLTFTIKDAAGNTTTVVLDITVTNTAKLLKDLTRKNLPEIASSVTLEALLGLVEEQATTV